MAAQRPKKNFPHKFLAFLNVYYPKTNLIKTLNYLDSSRSNGRLSQNSKTGGFREFFYLKMISKLTLQNFKDYHILYIVKNCQIFIKF